MRGRDELDRLVTGAHRRRLLSLAGECLILGAAALLSAATVAVLGGDEARRPAVWSAAALCGALIAASRWMGSGREKRAAQPAGGGSGSCGGTARSVQRSPRDRMLAGVCGGLAEYTGLDASLLRLLVAFVVLASGIVTGLVVYLVAALIMPDAE